MDLIELTSDYGVTEFDCGDEQLNKFLFEDAKPSLELRIANALAFRFITVDAYLSAVPFYEKNGFLHLTKKDEDEHTRLMYFDMMEIAE